MPPCPNTQIIKPTLVTPRVIPGKAVHKHTVWISTDQTPNRDIIARVPWIFCSEKLTAFSVI